LGFSPIPRIIVPVDTTYDLFAVTAPGLAPLAADELRMLEIEPLQVEPGGVAFHGPLTTVYRANLWLRTASRVLARVDEFPVRAFYELDKIARRLPWERFLMPGRPTRLRATCRKSRLYHSDAVAERVARSIEARLGRPGEFSPAGVEDAEGDEQDSSALVIVRLLHDQCTLSVDTSGALLHLRGYRQAAAKAPVRETLAAAMVIASGWDCGLLTPDSAPRMPFLDPMCGAGTIPIEAALLARDIAPGLNRRFAFMDWPGFDAALWQQLLDAAHGAVRPALDPIQASDRDAGAIEAARANAARAGVAGDIEFTQRALSAMAPPAGPGALVTNPPYGVRVGERDRLRNLYAQLGNIARQKLPGWTIAFLCADDVLARSVGLPLETAFETRNGGIPVRLMRGRVIGH
jgi:putative N6-adenine-specific DNA methylase